MISMRRLECRLKVARSIISRLEHGLRWRPGVRGCDRSVWDLAQIPNGAVKVTSVLGLDHLGLCGVVRGACKQSAETWPFRTTC